MWNVGGVWKQPQAGERCVASDKCLTCRGYDTVQNVGSGTCEYDRRTKGAGR